MKKIKTDKPDFYSLRPRKLMHDITMELYCDWSVTFFALPTTALHVLPQV